MRRLLLVFVWALPALVHAGDAPLDVRASSLKFTGHAFLHDFEGEAKEFSGSAQLDTKDSSLVHGAEIDISSAKLTTFEDTRDRNMYTWLQVTVNPDIRFQLTKVKLVQGDGLHATKATPARFKIGGLFTLNKVSKPLETEALARREGKLLVAEGKTQIDTAAHGLPEVKTLFLTVDKQVDIAFHLVFALP
jgi:polyisoprenoid-binding protein YceI